MSSLLACTFIMVASINTQMIMWVNNSENVIWGQKLTWALIGLLANQHLLKKTPPVTFFLDQHLESLGYIKLYPRAGLH